MTTLAAKGYPDKGIPAYLWNYGNYTYGILYAGACCGDVDVEDLMLDTAYEVAIKEFELVATKELTIY